MSKIDVKNWSAGILPARAFECNEKRRVHAADKINLVSPQAFAVLASLERCGQDARAPIFTNLFCRTA